MKYIDLSPKHNPNYLATICRIGEVYPIPGADRLVRTVINGYDLVISKDMVPGDRVVYFPVESVLSQKYLGANNMFDTDNYRLNSNWTEYESITRGKSLSILLEDDRQEAKKLCGFFTKTRRVRMIKLRDQYSMGLVMPIKSLEVAYGIDTEQLPDGLQFDMVGSDMIIHKYDPLYDKVPAVPQSRFKKRMKKLLKYDRIIPGTFASHYDTMQLGEHINDLSPLDKVTVTVKVHGVSGIFGYIETNNHLTLPQRIRKFFGKFYPDTVYDHIYSSRSVIKNRFGETALSRFLGRFKKKGFYKYDIWSEISKVLAPVIDRNMIIYGEIVGWADNQPIQANHDYGCEKGEWKFMPYRIVSSGFEWEIQDVIDWTNKSRERIPQLMPMTLLYHGTLSSRYSDIPLDDNFSLNALGRMKNDFGLEQSEPLCKNKVPREGVVIRIDRDRMPRAWKLKSKAHYDLEAKQHDAGQVDMEESN